MHSAPEGFYFQASNGSVALPVAGYIYNSDWTPLLAGLSPAGMAASLAAPEPYGPNSGIRLPPAEAAEKTWRRLNGHNQLPKIILGIKFTDGIEIVRSQAQTAAA